MVQKLSDIKVGGLKSVRRTPKRRPPPGAQIETRPPEEAIQDVSEMPIISEIPDIQPFLIPDLIPDIIDLYRWSGIKHFVEVTKLSLPDKPTDILVNELTAIWNEGNFHRVYERVLQIDPNMSDAVMSELIDDGAQNGLITAIRLADPTNPVSIIFNNPIQNIHRETEKVEINMLLEEPEVVEIDDIPCPRCRSHRVRIGNFVQTRSGDEAPDVLAICVECKTNWKIRG